MMTTTQQTLEVENKKGQVIQSAAEIYETFFVPALFRQWPPVIADMLDVKADDQILDVACGTGVVAKYVAERVLDPSQVHGIDINSGMLSVAKQSAPGIQWQEASVEQLPFLDNYFDKVVCQFGLMFFENRPKAVEEMVRVLKPGGTLAILVWDKLENTPGYQTVTDLLQSLFGDTLANEMRAPFVLGDTEKLTEIMSEAGIENFKIVTLEGTALFPSVTDWIFTDIKGWTLADLMTEEQFQIFSREARPLLSKYSRSSNGVSFPAPAHTVVITK